MGLQTGACWVNVCNSVFLTVVAFAYPAVSSAQSIIQSESTHVTLVSFSDSAGRTTLTASVTTLQGGGVPGGTIQFVDEATLAVLGWADVAKPSIMVDHLPPGQHRFRADYSGTMNYLPLMVQPSQSVVLVQNVRRAPDVSVSSSDNPCALGALVTLTAVISSPDGPPRGAVTFRDGTQVLAAHVGLDRAGTASFTTSALLDGARAITAEYEGDGTYAPAASRRLLQDVGVRIQSSQLQRVE
jgi:hypothetical protein